MPLRFRSSYTPWRNGAVEHSEKELSRLLLSIAPDLLGCTEKELDLLSLVYIVLTNTVSPHRASVAHIKAFTGLDAEPPITTVYRLSLLAPISVLSFSASVSTAFNGFVNWPPTYVSSYKIQIAKIANVIAIKLLKAGSQIPLKMIWFLLSVKILVLMKNFPFVGMC